jgi:LuxR family transcriptional regulator
MQLNIDIPKTLAGLKEIATAGFVVGLHIRFAAATFLFQTYPRLWIEEYAREGLLLRDPTVAWVFSNEGHISWDELKAVDEADVLGKASKHGLRYGMTVGVARGADRSLGGFARSDRYFTAEEIAEIEAAVGRLHDSTDPARPIPQGVRDSLHRLSVFVTHP